MLRRVGTLSARLGRRSKSTALNVEVNQQGVAVLRLDCPGEVQNTLSMELIQEFDEVRTPRGVRAPPGVTLGTLATRAPRAVRAGHDPRRGG